jgi:uncharacterized membrane protein HdeD (DUF308 family)
MVSQKEKSAIQSLGAVLIVIGLFAFFYPWSLFYESNRDYTIPLGVLGVIIFIMGYILPSRKLETQIK